jgi:8-oxo-dGTP pyrophosphatase MutT (NUDIX family)
MALTDLRPASTVVLLRPSDVRFEVFLVRRNDAVAFMGGAHVFPGGRVDPDDEIGSDALATGSDLTAGRMADLPPRSAVAHAVAAVRELFEEGGVLLARRDGRLVTIDGDASARFAVHRHNLLAGTVTFADILHREDLVLALDQLAYFAHWVTPEIETKRFDTRFFIARVPEGQTPVHDEGETVHSEWLDPADATARCLNDEIALPPPTWTTLRELARFRSIDEVWRWAQAKPVPRVQPGFLKRGDEMLVFYPGDPLYPAIEGFDTPEETRFILGKRRWRPVRPD